MTRFQNSALGAVGLLVAAAVGFALVQPPRGEASSSQTALESPVTEAAFDVAAGPGFIARAAFGPAASASVRKFSDLDYDLDSVIDGSADVPRLFLASLPGDLGQIRETDVRKTTFLKTVLPLVLQVNEQIRADRRRLWSVRYRVRNGQPIDAIDRLWLVVTSEHYGVENGDLDTLAMRVDIVPPSLALAQAAEESGWGTSRFVREGNAMFGQWTYAEQQAMTPRQRDEGKRHKVRKFNNLLESVQAYARNLNTHRAYAAFRDARASMRRGGRPIDGTALAGYLNRYSERGDAYVGTIRTIIRVNDLGRLDDARLKAHRSSAESTI